MMRFRNRIKRDLGLDISAEKLLSAGTIRGLAAYLSSQTSISIIADLNIRRDGPPQTEDMALTLGDPDVAVEIQKEVTRVIEPYGFTWEDDVEDVLPSWDLGYEVFGSVAGSAKVNHRMIYSMQKAGVEELRNALAAVLKHHAMQRSFELRGLNGEPTMRAVMRANSRWLQYAIAEIPAVENPEDLVSLIHNGKHFSEVEHPYPSFLVRIAHTKSTNTAGMICALQHLAFDALSVFSFLEDLDAVLGNPQIPVKPHVPYKLWADAYYLYRSSLAAHRSIGYQVRRLVKLSSLTHALFPPGPLHNELPNGLITQRRSFLSKLQLTDLPHVSELKANHDIQVFIVVKAALALFLAHKTNSPLALFSQNENGRSWPFQENWIQNQLPQCMDLAGPTCLNWLPVRTKNGVISFTNMQYYDTKANCESWFLFNCGMQDKRQMWVQILADEDRVPMSVAEEWARMVLSAVKWMADMQNWRKRVGEFGFLSID
jgi:hypothetical protein